MLELTQIVAILSSTLFAGAALYVSLVEHPARLSCGTELAATEFGPSYKRATVMQVVLAARSGRRRDSQLRPLSRPTRRQKTTCSR